MISKSHQVKKNTQLATLTESVISEMFNVNGILDFAKQNVGTLMTLLESIWAIVKGNIGLLLGSFSAFLSVILGGGTAVLNFILNGVIIVYFAQTI